MTVQACQTQGYECKTLLPGSRQKLQPHASTLKQDRCMPHCVELDDSMQG